MKRDTGCPAAGFHGLKTPIASPMEGGADSRTQVERDASPTSGGLQLRPEPQFVNDVDVFVAAAAFFLMISKLATQAAISAVHSFTGFTLPPGRAPPRVYPRTRDNCRFIVTPVTGRDGTNTRISVFAEGASRCFVPPA